VLSFVFSFLVSVSVQLSFFEAGRGRERGAARRGLDAAPRRVRGRPHERGGGAAGGGRRRELGERERRHAAGEETTNAAAPAALKVQHTFVFWRWAQQ